MPRQPDPLVTQRVLTAARRLVDSGKSWSMADVARTAETSRAAVYRRFSSRAALLAAVSSSSGGSQPASPPIRERVLDAVERALRAGSIARTTIEQLAIDADVGPASIYRHFGSREQLLEAFAQERSPRALPAAFELDSVPIEMALRLIAEAMVYQVIAHAPMILAGLSPDPETQRLSQHLLEMEAQGRKQLQHLLQKRIDMGELSGDAALLADNFVALIGGTALIRRDQDPDAAKLAHSLVSLFLSGCRPAGAASAT